MLLLAGCAAPAKPPVANDIAIQFLPLGVHTNVFIPHREGATYGLVTDDLGLLYLQGLLPD